MRAAAGIAIVVVLLWSVDAQAADGPTTTPAVYQGRVSGPDDRPIAGARVSLYDFSATQNGSPATWSGTTDSQGQFRCPSPAPRSTIIVQAAGYGLCATAPPRMAEDGPVDFQLKAATNMRVSLAGTDGLPLAGVRVGVVGMWERFNSSSGGGVPTEIRDRLAQTTDQNGMCIFADMPQWTSVVVRVIDPQYLGENVGIDTMGPVPIDAPPIRVAKGVIIEGRVVRGDTGAPVPNLHVSDRVASSSGGAVHTGTTTDAQGRFRYTQLLAGQHVLVPRPSSPLNAQFTGEASAPLQVNPGDSIGGVELKLVAGALVRGKVTVAGTGRPVPGAYVVVNNGQEISVDGSGAVTGPDGTYVVCITPGPWVVRVGTGLASHGLLRPALDRQAVLAALDRETIVDFQAPANPSSTAVTGRVVDEQGRPVEGALVDASVPVLTAITGPVPDRAGGTAVTDADGRFQIPFVTDGIVLRASKGRLRLPDRITIDAAHRDLNLVLRAPSRGALVAHVVDEAGQPFAGVPVRVDWNRNEPGFALDQMRGRTGPDGSFRAASLETGAEYTVSIGGTGYTFTRRDKVKVEADTVFDLPPVQITRANSFVAGIVLDENGQPVIGATVQLDPVRTTRSGFDGRFRFDSIVPGSSPEISARLEGREGQVTGGRVVAGTENAEIILRPRVPYTRRGGRGRAGN